MLTCLLRSLAYLFHPLSFHRQTTSSVDSGFHRPAFLPMFVCSLCIPSLLGLLTAGTALTPGEGSTVQLGSWPPSSTLLCHSVEGAETGVSSQPTPSHFG